MNDPNKRKSRVIQWLEETTGRDLGNLEDAELETRHLSLRLPVWLHRRLDEEAAAQHSTVSDVVREILWEAMHQTAPVSRADVDQAISTLKRLRRSTPPTSAA